MCKLGFSESSLDPHCIHPNHNWIGMYGINAPVWQKHLPFNLYIVRGNIWSAAYILKHYLDLSDGNYEEALTRYKGYSPYGRKLARHVLALQPQG